VDSEVKESRQKLELVKKKENNIILLLISHNTDNKLTNQLKHRVVIWDRFVVFLPRELLDRQVEQVDLLDLTILRILEDSMWQFSTRLR
jgi:hypothetical protein